MSPVGRLGSVVGGVSPRGDGAANRVAQEDVQIALVSMPGPRTQ